MDETKEGIQARKIPYKAADFIPFIGLFTRKIRVARECSSLEGKIRRDYSIPQPNRFERYMDLPNALLDWREKQVRANENLREFKFDLYHLATAAIPLVYGIFFKLSINAQKIIRSQLM